ncbi:MAG: PucR family transcriptional regulator [Chloroflexota bacterium]
MVTVKEIWQEALPEGTRLLAGNDQLGRQVSWALVLKPRPPGLDAAHGDELILLSTSTLPALDPRLTLARALTSLAGKASAVAVRGDVSPDAVTEAGRVNLALLHLPPSVPLVETERNVLRYLSEQRSEWYRRKHSILHDLTALALQGSGLQAVAQHIGDITGHAVMFEDERGESIAWHIPSLFPDQHREATEGYAEGHASIPEAGKGQVRTAGDLAKLTAPILLNNQPTGMVSIIGPVETLSGEARLVLEAGATAGAIVLTREHAVLETVHRIQGDVVSELVSGAGDAQALLRRAQRLGYDLEVPHIAFAIHPNGGPPAHDGLLVLGKRLHRVLSTYELRAPFHIDDDLLVAFVPVDEDSRPPAWKRLAERLRRDLADAAPNHQLCIGISRPQLGPEGVRTSYAEARRALQLGHALAPERPITYFGDLGIYRLLFAMRETTEMQEFHNEMLGQLASYDREKNTELIPTLDAFLSSNNATEVAVRLNLHRNSLLYRLRRIREITGLDLDDAETRLALHLALRVGDTLRTGLTTDG